MIPGLHTPQRESHTASMRTAEWNETVSVLDRITAILEAFTVDDRSLGISELARRTKLPKSTVSRLVGDLVTQRYLEREGNAIRLGLRLFELGQMAGQPKELRGVALPIMADLRGATGETVHLGVLDGNEIVYLAILRGQLSVRLPSRVGGRLPAHATGLGKAMLAFSSDDVVRQAVDGGLKPLTSATIIDPVQLRQELAIVRSGGLAYESEESAPGLACVASPIMSSMQEPVAAISISGPADTLDVRRLGPAVRTAALVLSRRLASRSYSV